MSKPHIIIVDHRNANIRSLKNAVSNICDGKLEVSSSTSKINQADFIILPGVGAFPDSIKDIENKGLVEELQHQALNKKKPFLGICLGMHLLFESSTEGGLHKGLGLIPGKVEVLELRESFRIPHIGWNDIKYEQNNPIFKSLGNDKNFYFVHSYHVKCKTEYVIAQVDYDQNITAAVQKENILGFQFHPEKSQKNGSILLKNFFNESYF